MITEIEYKLLKLFPTDQTKKALHKYSNSYSKWEFTGTTLTSVIERLVSLHFLEKNEKSEYSITDEGLKAIMEYETKSERENEISNLNYQKLKYDTKNSKRVYETYWSTRIMAIVALLSSIFLLLLKLAEALGVWPYNK